MSDGEQALSQQQSYTARPTLRIDGQPNSRADQLLCGMKMHEAEGGLSALELIFTNWASREDGTAGAAFEDEAALKLGSALKVYGGEMSAPTELFAGKVSAIEFAFDGDGPPRLLLQAEDGAQKARLTRRIEVHENTSVADIARAVAARMGLTPVVSGLTDSTGVWVQFNESDLAFLRRLLVRHGADCQVVGNELHVSPRADVRRNDVELTLRSQLRRVRVVADLAHQVSDIRVTGFNAEQGEAVEGTGAGAALGPGQGRSGKDLLSQVFGDREEQAAHYFVGTQAEARALAEAEFARRARGFVRVEGEAKGNPALRVGTHVRIAAVSPRFDGPYYVTSCTHRFDLRLGYRTEFVAESAYLGNPQ